MKPIIQYTGVSAACRCTHSSHYQMNQKGVGRSAILGDVATISRRNFVMRAHENNGNSEKSYELQCSLRTQGTANCEASTIESNPNGRAPVEYHGEAIVDILGS